MRIRAAALISVVVRYHTDTGLMVVQQDRRVDVAQCSCGPDAFYPGLC